MYEDMNVIWVPSGNPTLINGEKKDKLFPTETNYRPLSFIAVADKGESVITTGVMDDLVSLRALIDGIVEYDNCEVDMMFNVKEGTDSGNPFTFDDLCLQRVYRPTDGGDAYSYCWNETPLDFIYDINTRTYNVPATDAELLALINTGKGDPDYYGGSKYIFVGNMYGQTVPEEVSQDIDITDDTSTSATTVGQNDIVSA